MSEKPQWVAPPSQYGAGEDDGDIEAYWDSASPDRNKKNGIGPGARYGHGPIEFVPLYVTLIDSDMNDENTAKSSTLLHGRLLKPAKLRNADKDDPQDREFAAGTIIGIWTKAAMKPLKKLAGAEVWLGNGQLIRGEPHYFKALPGRGVPMVLFTILPNPNTPGSPITVKNDYREDSLPDAARLKKAQLKREREEAAPVDLDDIPF